MQYYEPNFLDEALVLLERFGSHARVLAGGTRLGPYVRRGAPDVGALINVKRIDELSEIALGSATLRIGALATAAQLRSHALVRELVPVLAAAAATMGARQLQTVATLGGNVCSGDPASDLSVALLACDAQCQIATSNDVAALVPVEQLLAKPRPVLRPHELLTAFEVPLGLHRFSFQKMTTRRAFEMALVAVALQSRMDGDIVAHARIGLAGAASTPIRATAAEAVLRGERLTERVASEVGRVAAQADARPESDWRASSVYRRALVAILTERAVLAAGSPSALRPSSRDAGV